MELTQALHDLSMMLHQHYGIAPIIIIDEYDIPIQQGYMKGYYDQVILFMRNLFSGGLKDNKHLSFGFLAGILLTPKGSIFSGLNNLTINSVLDKKYSASTIYSFLLVTGYLKVLKTTPSFNGDFMCEVALPNKEISLVYHKEILQQLDHIISQATAISVQEAIFSADNQKLQAMIQNLLTQSVSSFDTGGENFYRGFVLGLCALLGDFYVTSNRESGDGRYDIQLKPRKKTLPGILIELKAEKNCTAETLKKLSETALRQINDKKYDTAMVSEGVQTVYKYGVAFSGKNVAVSVG